MRFAWPVVVRSALVVLTVACGDASGSPPPPPPPEPMATPPIATPPAPAPAPFAMHPVAEGQTLWDIARAYGVRVDDILTANDMKSEDVRRLSKGVTLKIPGATQVVTVETAAERAARNPATAQPAANRIGIVHQVVRGETVWDIARAFQVGVAAIMAANSMNEDDVTRLREGARLFIPGVEQDKHSRPLRKRASAREVQAASVARQLGLGTTKVAGDLLYGRVAPRWVLAASKKQVLPGTLRWPVTDGWFVRGYGSGEGGYHQAMDIAGKIGWNVRAAAPGIVGYAGDGVSGYGNMVLIIHSGGWVTLYAHNSVNYVVAGERVVAGAVIAEVGSTGISRGPHVHFELIHAGKNCDPGPLLRPHVRHRNGTHAAIKQVTWTQPNSRPREVQCAPRRRHPRHSQVLDEDPSG